MLLVLFQICWQIDSSIFANIIKGLRLRVEIIKKQTDKLEFGEPTVSGNLSPQGGIIIAQRGAATRRNAGFGIKKNGTPTNVEGWQGSAAKTLSRSFPSPG